MEGVLLDDVSAFAVAGAMTGVKKLFSVIQNIFDAADDTALQAHLDAVRMDA